jgi:histidinol-phosphatase (PHP family)
MHTNYHTHTYRCNHAAGEEREYIENAIAGGIKTLGFADHAPMPFRDGYFSGFRMRCEQLEEYVATLRGLQQEYKDRIRILIGFETEYYPAVFEDFLKLIQPYAPDYLILGQHALDNEANAHFTSAGTDDPALLKKYVDQVTEGLATGKFLYLAHPDVMRFTGDREVYEQEMTRLCRFCKEREIPVEINLLGMMDNRFYPTDAFWHIAAREGNSAIIGCDAHHPWVLSNRELHQRGEAFARQFGLPLLTQLDL